MSTNKKAATRRNAASVPPIAPKKAPVSSLSAKKPAAKRANPPAPITPKQAPAASSMVLADNSSALNSQSSSSDGAQISPPSATDLTKDDSQPIKKLCVDLNVVIRFAKPKNKGAGPGRRPTRFPAKHVKLELTYGKNTKFAVFSAAVISAIKSRFPQYSLAIYSYVDLDLELKIPKGPAAWRKPGCINKHTLQDFLDALLSSKDGYAEGKVEVNEIVESSDSCSDSNSSDKESDEEQEKATSKKRRGENASREGRAGQG
ncbi:hypothetical protein A4X13_0g6398 [Tilletia indica]|uniref:Uncharacterized protein n=1 Tax=Tilletia indica TaxID=43049 RepID=A0A177T7B3_9BASI|nr:hypothetical protein A4X13_0g6398 [Tilletia indica]